MNSRQSAVIVAILAGVALSSCQFLQRPQVKPTAVAAPQQVERPLTQSDYDAITNGMSLSSVRYLLDRDGTEVSRTGNDFTVMFESEGVAIMVLFMNGEVFGKSIGTANP